MFTKRNCILRVSIIINILVLLHFSINIITEYENNIIHTIQQQNQQTQQQNQQEQQNNNIETTYELLLNDGNSNNNIDKLINNKLIIKNYTNNNKIKLRNNNELLNKDILTSNDIISAKDILNIKEHIDTSWSNLGIDTTMNSNKNNRNNISNINNNNNNKNVNNSNFNFNINNNNNNINMALFCKNYSNNNNNNNNNKFNLNNNINNYYLNLKKNIPCNNIEQKYYIAQHGDFWVLHNYIIGERKFHCWESITYTSHSDYTFLDNLVPLLDRWQGPVSIALYAPGTDFNNTIDTIRYLRECTSPLVAEFVTFHIYFGAKHAPDFIPKPVNIFNEAINCSETPPWALNISTYKNQKKLLYPVNVGRNIARQTAVTYYILASDIELYPSPGIIADFLDMILRQDPPLKHSKPKVFPLSIFEIESHMNPPNSKIELISMLKNGSAIPFHKKVCSGCHNVPKSKEWMKAPIKSGIHIFHIGKRLGYFVHWEPIYIGTHQDPYYDERLSWEGKSDKMTQGYVMCVMDYEFQILDNAFLVHKPGIKTLKKDHARAVLAGKTNALIRKVIMPELKILYGLKKGCAV